MENEAKVKQFRRYAVASWVFTSICSVMLEVIIFLPFLSVLINEGIKAITFALIIPVAIATILVLLPIIIQIYSIHQAFKRYDHLAIFNYIASYAMDFLLLVLIIHFKDIFAVGNTFFEQGITSYNVLYFVVLAAYIITLLVLSSLAQSKKESAYKRKKVTGIILAVLLLLTMIYNIIFLFVNKNRMNETNFYVLLALLILASLNQLVNIGVFSKYPGINPDGLKMKTKRSKDKPQVMSFISEDDKDLVHTSIVELPGDINCLEDYQYQENLTLIKADINNTITSIGQGCFKNCVSLQEVIIPRSVSIIGKEAFANCTKLSKITYLGTMKEFRAVNRGVDWLTNTQSNIVCCSDGKLKMVKSIHN